MKQVSDTGAIEAVVEGGSFFSQELLFNLVSNLKSAPSAVPDDSAEQLSQRESEILLHICRGESNNEIADALFISKRTVDKHRSNILAKTGCKNTANLVVYAPALHSVSGEAFSVRLVSARSCFAWRRCGILIFLALRV